MVEPRVVVGHREHLWCLLGGAAQLEHMIMCQAVEAVRKARQRASTMAESVAAHYAPELRAPG